MRGLIYKIVHSQSDLVYVGMTTSTLTKRWQHHKSDCNSEHRLDCAIYPFMRQHGIDQFKIMLIKEYDIVDKTHLRVYETLWMNKLKCINKNVSFNPTPKIQRKRQYNKNNKYRISEYNKQYRETHKEAKVEYDKQYRETHKDKLSNYRKQYAIDNKDKIALYNKQYTSDNKEIISLKRSEKIECVCGAMISKRNKARHERSQRHLQYVN